mmetsp:Transcript_32632/g.101694  ORF Transcript_32632/g.101694 Transcript_32632/m.101694 type:complete len:413 (-) Transcript_32632:578-1816(-)
MGALRDGHGPRQQPDAEPLRLAAGEHGAPGLPREPQLPGHAGRRGVPQRPARGRGRLRRPQPLLVRHRGHRPLRHGRRPGGLLALAADRLDPHRGAALRLVVPQGPGDAGAAEQRLHAARLDALPAAGGDDDHRLLHRDVLGRHAHPVPRGRHLLRTGLLERQVDPAAGLAAAAGVHRGDHPDHLAGALPPGRRDARGHDAGLLRPAEPLPQRLELAPQLRLRHRAHGQGGVQPGHGHLHHSGHQRAGEVLLRLRQGPVSGLLAAGLLVAAADLLLLPGLLRPLRALQRPEALLHFLGSHAVGLGVQMHLAGLVRGGGHRRDLHRGAGPGRGEQAGLLLQARGQPALPAGRGGPDLPPGPAHAAGARHLPRAHRPQERRRGPCGGRGAEAGGGPGVPPGPHGGGPAEQRPRP